MGFVVTVMFELDGSEKERFKSLVLGNARMSLEREEGCWQFDVCQSPDGIYLYEVYASQGAFDEHLKSEHFLAFDAAVSDMIKSKVVHTYERLNT